MTTTRWTATLPTRMPASASRPRIRGFTAIKATVVQDAGLRVDRAGPDHSGKHSPGGISLPTLAQPQPQELTGDKAYDSKANRSHLAALGLASGFHLLSPQP